MRDEAKGHRPLAGRGGEFEIRRYNLTEGVEHFQAALFRPPNSLIVSASFPRTSAISCSVSPSPLKKSRW
jgi:hypothetical protein